jgi:hypothetical protein
MFQIVVFFIIFCYVQFVLLMCLFNYVKVIDVKLLFIAFFSILLSLYTLILYPHYYFFGKPTFLMAIIFIYQHYFVILSILQICFIQLIFLSTKFVIII